MMIAFHGKQEIKDKYIARVREHALADEIIKGSYWENGKGCAVGCTIHSGKHEAYEKELGIPRILARLEDSIFEGLPLKLAKTWPETFLKSIRVGSDLSQVWPKFAIWLLTDEKYGVTNFSKTPKSILDISNLHLRHLKEGVISEELDADAAAAGYFAAAYATIAAGYAASAYVASDGQYAADFASYAADAHAAAERAASDDSYAKTGTSYAAAAYVAYSFSAAERVAAVHGASTAAADSASYAAAAYVAYSFATAERVAAERIAAARIAAAAAAHAAAATDAAYVAARDQARIRQSEKLLSLLSEAPVKWKESETVRW